jgi:protein-disulfide isomerase
VVVVGAVAVGWRAVQPGAPDAVLSLPAAAPASPPPASTDARMGERAIGNAAAKVTVREFFSLTCPHCARFAKDVLPEIKKQLIDPGKLRMVFHDFPLDQLALTASMIARYLPAERYEPFCLALLASQDRWAFARGVNSTEELRKMAALAGLSREAFDAAIADTALRSAILAGQDADSKTYQIDSTPTFIFNGPGVQNHREVGERSATEFTAAVAQATG